MAFVAVYDANVLYPSVLRDVLIRVAAAGLVQAKWTEAILDETFREVGGVGWRGMELVDNGSRGR